MAEQTAEQQSSESVYKRGEIQRNLWGVSRNAGVQNGNLVRLGLRQRLPTSDKRLTQRRGPRDQDVRGVEHGRAGERPIERLSIGRLDRASAPITAWSPASGAR
jgi:hypothetical protein